jgi:uncharacterized protein
MPVATTYPGVYVEEIPSGVRTITGVATSMTAFVGRAPRGPINDPILVNSLADFGRTFGGVAEDFPMTYAVEDYFVNGGAQALVVRLYKKADANSGSAVMTFGAGDKALKLTAVSPGTWANALRAEVDRDFGGVKPEELKARFGVEQGDLFNLTFIRLNPDGTDGDRERIRNVTVKAGNRRIDRVLARDSKWFAIPEPAVDDATGALKADAPTDAGKEKRVEAKDGGDSAPLTDKNDFLGEADKKTGLNALAKTDIFNLLCIPADRRDSDVPKEVLATALQLCVERRAVLIVDAPMESIADPFNATTARKEIADLDIVGTAARNAAIFYPRILRADSEREGEVGTFVPCGAIAGVIARTDVQRGVWKASAGVDAGLAGIEGPSLVLNDLENGTLNPFGINCLRAFPVFGNVVWGARTMRGADQLADEYKYLAVRRLALYIEESLYRGTQWVVFEPNDEPLWAQVRLNVGAFMHTLFRQGAFAGRSPKEAYFVKCDAETTPQNDVNLGIVNIVVGFAPLKPAEFVIIKLQQMPGQIDA